MGDEPHPALGSLLLKNVNLVGATCVGLENRSLGIDNMDFDLVIMDEAGKALPGELLIPYNRAHKVIIIGDHKQLPPTVDSAYFAISRQLDEDLDESKDDLFEKSLFQRMFEKCGDCNKAMLTTQYRMPAVVGTLISELFYEGKLSNTAGTEDNKPVLLVKDGDESRQNIIFISHSEPEFSLPGKSVFNYHEIEFVKKLLSTIDKIDRGLRIAIITPYKGQKGLLKKAIKQIDFTGDNEIIQPDTVDSFQGDEADVVIFLHH